MNKGLINMGGICYYNSLLQALMSINRLKDKDDPIQLKILNNINISDKNPETLHVNLFQYIKKILSEKNEWPDYFQGQQCAAEMYSLMLQSMAKTPILKLFYHRYYHYITCLDCDTKSPKKVEHNNMLIVPSNTQDLAKYILKQEENIEFTCGKCSSKNAKKISKLMMAPPILVFLIKKYCNQSTVQFNVIYLPSKQNLTYKPIAFIQHYGNINGGHYNACCLRNNTWLTFDDTSIYAQSPDFKNAYLVFYELLN